MSLLPEDMKAIFLVKNGESQDSFEIRDTEMPKAGAGQVVIKVQASGLNFADVMAKRGLYGEAPPLPAILGYDVSGTISEIGQGVTGFSIGQAVTAMTRFGGYAEYVATQAEAVAPLPANYSPEKATSLTTQACTAVYCAEEVLKLY